MVVCGRGKEGRIRALEERRASPALARAELKEYNRRAVEGSIVGLPRVTICSLLEF